MTKVKNYQKTWGEAIKSGDLDIPELSFRKKIVLKALRIVRIENRRYAGWSGDLPFYLFNCSKHGLVCDYKHEWPPFETLHCPLCR